MRGWFLFIALSWGLVSLYHLSRFALRRRYVSLVVALYPLGWVAFALREMRVLPRVGAIPFVSLAACLGLFVVGALIFHEMRRARPFR